MTVAIIFADLQSLYWYAYAFASKQTLRMSGNHMCVLLRAVSAAAPCHRRCRRLAARCSPRVASRSQSPSS